MGKKLDAILGRNFKASKFKSLVNLATSRLSVFKNQRHVRCNQARSDVLQLLQLGHHERALLRVEHVIKEQNILDVYVMMEGYCDLLVERIHLIEQDRVCPDELKEAISGLLYASTRCGDFPELQEIRSVFTSRYGKEFAARAIELRNHCGVNRKMIQKLSTGQPDLDSRMRLLKEIALENNVVLQLEDTPVKIEEKLDIDKKRSQSETKTSNNSGSPKLVDQLQISSEEMEKDGFIDSVKTRRKYRDVADAAQAAFESAAYAAAAARAAVELSRSKPHDPDNQNSPHNHVTNSPEKDNSTKLEFDPRNHKLNNENDNAELKVNNAAEQKSSTSTTTPTSKSEMMEDDLRVNSMILNADHLSKQLEEDIVFYDSDSEGNVHEVEKVPPILQAGINVDSRHRYSTAIEAPGLQSSQHLNREKGPISVRTKGLRGY